MGRSGRSCIIQRAAPGSGDRFGVRECGRWIARSTCLKLQGYLMRRLRKWYNQVLNTLYANDPSYRASAIYLYLGCFCCSCYFYFWLCTFACERDSDWKLLYVKPQSFLQHQRSTKPHKRCIRPLPKHG